MCDAVPGKTVTANETLPLLNAGEEATSMYVPAAVGSVHCVSTASPFASVVTLDDEIEPPLEDTEKRTVMPATPLPATSFTTTVGSCGSGCPAFTVSVLAPDAAIVAGAPAAS